ncbi:hypothetical protein G3N95_09840 [Paraburkholderia sp. Tr-20389]|nr:hypothetical protein [Paraburkholderia sp. Tr-20389]MBN3753246.1 hypothetical protein [Paraburkholderia sp. Tr-20389]
MTAFSREAVDMFALHDWRGDFHRKVFSMDAGLRVSRQSYRQNSLYENDA